MNADRKKKLIASVIFFSSFVISDALRNILPGAVRDALQIGIVCVGVWWLMPFAKPSGERDGGMNQSIDHIIGPLVAAVLVPGVPFSLYEMFTQRQITSPVWGAYKMTAGILLTALGLMYFLTIAWRALLPSRPPDAP